MRIVKIVMLFSFILTYVFGDYVYVLGQQSLTKHSVLFALKTHGISETAFRTLIDELKREPSLSRDVRIIEINEMNLTLSANEKPLLGIETSEEDIIEAAKFNGVKWVIIGEIKRVKAMHMVSMNIIDVELNKSVESMREDEPGTFDEIQNIIVRSVIEKLMELIMQKEIKTPVTMIKKKKSRTMYYLLGIIAVVGGGVASASGGGGGGGGSNGGGGGGVTPTDLPGTPPGPP